MKKGAVKPNDLLAFANLASTIRHDDEYALHAKHLNPMVADRLGKTRALITEKGYSLHLYFATTGTCADAVREEAQSRARAHGGEMFVLARDAILDGLQDYLDGVAPAVPLVQLPLDPTGTIHRWDEHGQIDVWVCTIRGSDIGDLYTRHGTKHFARNIRGSLGSTGVNKALARTLQMEPERFWYFNNGITVECDHVESVVEADKTVLRMTNPQIINGQQTTLAMADAPNADAAAVLVRVFAPPKNVGFSRRPHQ